jgi:LCP family protein required for cell wall assembly
MRIRRSTPLILLSLTLLACQLFSGTATPTSPLVGTIAAATLTADASTSVVPAPGPASTLVPDLNPTAAPDGSIPAPTAALPLADGEVTILLMGSDQRPNAPDFRTDTILLVVIKNDGSVNLVSFPRDLWVYLPERSMQRINAAVEFGGFNLVRSTFQYNFGFAPQSYVLTNFSGFRFIVDGLGGIDVQVGQTFTDARDGYPNGFTVQSGLVHMDGETALWYVRARKNTSDLDRLRRAQEVILAIGHKLLSLNSLARIPELYSIYRGAFVTDMTLHDVVTISPALQHIDPNKIQRYSIGMDQVIPFVTSDGADVLLPRADAIRQVLIQVLGSQTSP